MSVKSIEPRSSGTANVSLEEKIAFLSSPTAYPGRTDRVDIEDTHMSSVFLVGDTVFKLKKPVKYPFLDFSTIAAREFNCREELRLNRRLAPDIYLDVVPLTLQPDGALAVDETGQVVDWLVKMRRLPENRMLDRMIETGTITQVKVEAVADLLTNFYANAAPAELAPPEYIAEFLREIALNEKILTMPEFDLPHTTVNTVMKATRYFVDRNGQLLLDRAENDYIVEGHGDLRPQHVSLSDPPVIIDCLEFNRSLRLIDPFDELVYLKLECERLGASWVGDLLIKRCADGLGGAPSDKLLAFYTAFRASLRARLALEHLLEPEPRKPEKWVPLAKQYLAIAVRAISRMAPLEAQQ